MTLTSIVIDGKKIIIPEKRKEMFAKIITGIKDGFIQPVNPRSRTLQRLLKPFEIKAKVSTIEEEPEAEANGWWAELTAKLGWNMKKGAHAEVAGKIHWESAQEQESNLRIGIAGGAIATPWGSVGIIFPFVYTKADGTTETLYLRVIETDQGTLYLPSQHDDTFANLEHQIQRKAAVIDTN